MVLRARPVDEFIQIGFAHAAGHKLGAHGLEQLVEGFGFRQVRIVAVVGLGAFRGGEEDGIALRRRPSAQLFGCPSAIDAVFSHFPTRLPSPIALPVYLAREKSLTR